jgi:hypothetical protein
MTPTDLATLRAELEWCQSQPHGMRTGFALQWAIELLDELEKENAIPDSHE